MLYCANCGEGNPDTNKFCLKCGVELLRVESIKPVDSRPPLPISGRAEGRKMPGKRVGVLLAIAGAGLFLVMVVVAVLLLPSSLPKSERVFLGFPNRSSGADLYLMKLGQEAEDGVLLAENARVPSRSGFFLVERGGRTYPLGGKYGGFLPNSNRVLYWYQDDEDVVVREIKSGATEWTEIIATDALPLYGAQLQEQKTLFLLENRAPQERCYAAKPGQEAQRLGKGDRCWISDNGASVFIEEESQGELTLFRIGLDGEDEIVVLDELDDVFSVKASDDGSHVAYARYTNNGQKLYIVETSSGAVSKASYEASYITEYEFVPESDVLYFTAQDSEGIIELYTSDNTTPIADDVSSHSVLVDPKGEYLVYMTEDEDGEQSIYVHSMKEDVDTLVLDGEGLDYRILSSINALMIWEQDGDDLVLYSANVDGSDLLELINRSDALLSNLITVRDHPVLFILTRDSEGRMSLFATPIDKAEEFRLLDEWGRIGLLNLSSNGRQLVFWGMEDLGDNPVLYSVAVETGSDPIELDDDSDSFQNAVFSKDGKSIIYTAVTGQSPDDVSVFEVPVDGRERYQVLYKEAFLADVSWDELNPFNY